MRGGRPAPGHGGYLSGFIACIRGEVTAACLGAGQNVTAFVFGMPGVSFQPVKIYLVLAQEGQHALPQVYIEHRFFVGLDPVFFTHPHNQSLLTLSYT